MSDDKTVACMYLGQAKAAAAAAVITARSEGNEGGKLAGGEREGVRGRGGGGV